MPIYNLTITSVASLVISLVVLFGSLHAVQVLSDQKPLHDDATLVKLSVDLHHHTDKAQFGDQSMYADGRSLKLHRSIKHKLRGAQWLQDWWQLHGLSLG